MFLIDKNGLVLHLVDNNLPLGRNLNNVLRLVDALQFTEEFSQIRAVLTSLKIDLTLLKRKM